MKNILLFFTVFIASCGESGLQTAPLPSQNDTATTKLEIKTEKEFSLKENAIYSTQFSISPQLQPTDIFEVIYNPDLIAVSFENNYTKIIIKANEINNSVKTDIKFIIGRQSIKSELFIPVSIEDTSGIKALETVIELIKIIDLELNTNEEYSIFDKLSLTSPLKVFREEDLQLIYNNLEHEFAILKTKSASESTRLKEAADGYRSASIDEATLGKIYEESQTFIQQYKKTKLNILNFSLSKIFVRISYPYAENKGLSNFFENKLIGTIKNGEFIFNDEYEHLEMILSAKCLLRKD